MPLMGLTAMDNGDFVAITYHILDAEDNNGSTVFGVNFVIT